MNRVCEDKKIHVLKQEGTDLEDEKMQIKLVEDIAHCRKENILHNARKIKTL